MVGSFERQIQELRERIHRDGDKIDETFRVGVEIEGCLLDKKGTPVNAEPLIKELEGSAYEIDYEYGRVNLNLRPLQWEWTILNI